MRESCDIAEITPTLEKLRTELEEVAGMMQRRITLNAQAALDQADYQRQFAEYDARYSCSDCT